MFSADYIENNLIGILETNIKFDKKNKINTHVIVIKEDDIYSAISIEFGEIGQGASLKNALKSMINDINDKIKYYISKDSVEEIYSDGLDELEEIYIKYKKLLSDISLAKFYNKKFNKKKFFKETPLFISNRKLKNSKDTNIKVGNDLGRSFGYVCG